MKNTTYSKIFWDQSHIVRKQHLINITSRMPNGQNHSIIFPLLAVAFWSVSWIRYLDTNNLSILYEEIIDSLPKLNSNLRIESREEEKEKKNKNEVRNKDLIVYIWFIKKLWMSLTPSACRCCRKFRSKGTNLSVPRWGFPLTKIPSGAPKWTKVFIT